MISCEIFQDAREIQRHLIDFYHCVSTKLLRFSPTERSHTCTVTVDVMLFGKLCRAL